MIFKNVLAIIALVAFEGIYGDEELVDRYEKLINEEILRSSTYQLPTDAREYEPKNAKSKGTVVILLNNYYYSPKNN